MDTITKQIFICCCITLLIAFIFASNVMADNTLIDQIGVNLSGADLSNQDFSDHDLTGADMSGANLSGTRFLRSKLTGVNLTGANLDQAIFVDAKLQGAIMNNVSAAEANFNNALIHGTLISDSNLSRGNFSGASFKGSNLSNSDLTGAYFSNTTIESTIIHNTNFDNTLLSNVTFINTSGTPLIRSIAGIESDLVKDNQPVLSYQVNTDSFISESEQFPGLVISPNTAIVAIEATMSVVEFNQMVASLNGNIIGSLPAFSNEDIGLIVLSFEITDPESLQQKIAQIKAISGVRFAIPDSRIFGSVITPEVSSHDDWKWSQPDEPEGGNYAFELSRIPQMWNLKHSIDLATKVPIAIVDNKQVTWHRDLPNPIYEIRYGKRKIASRHENAEFTYHGTHTAGTIAAIHNNGGVDGVNPFAEVYSVDFGNGIGVGTLGQVMIDAFGNIQRMDEFSVKIVNMSLAYNARSELDLTDDARLESYRNATREAGNLFAAKLRTMQNVLVVAAAGNDSGKKTPSEGRSVADGACFRDLPYRPKTPDTDIELQAMYASPWNYAALGDQVMGGALNNLIVVGSVGLNEDSDPRESSFSNSGADLLAAGENILSTYPDCDLTVAAREQAAKEAQDEWCASNPSEGPFCGGPPPGPEGEIPDLYFSSNYHYLSGTSMATPVVSGIAGFLLAVDPELSPQELITLLKDNTLPLEGATLPVVDAWGAMMGIDALPNKDDEVIKRLVDIDDFTLDGNLREKLFPIDETGCKDPAHTESVDARSPADKGDGDIDMSDFRTWRDWYIYSQSEIEAELNGVGHQYFDLNYDGRLLSGDQENLYPRGDFNGDGKISLDDKFKIPGALRRLPPQSDLEVLKSQFDDPLYSRSEIFDLVNSGDIEIIGTRVFEEDGVPVENQIFYIEGEVRRASDDTSFKNFTLWSENWGGPGRVVITAPVIEGGYIVQLFAYNRRNEEPWPEISPSRTWSPKRGGDSLWVVNPPEVSDGEWGYDYNYEGCD